MLVTAGYIHVGYCRVYSCWLLQGMDLNHQNVTYFQNFIIKLNFAVIHVHKMPCDQIDEKLPAFHILVVQISIPTLSNMSTVTS